jgi:hypothetical protein
VMPCRDARILGDIGAVDSGDPETKRIVRRRVYWDEGRLGGGGCARATCDGPVPGAATAIASYVAGG